jgi:hypothetical protein
VRKPAPGGRIGSLDLRVRGSVAHEHQRSPRWPGSGRASTFVCVGLPAAGRVPGRTPRGPRTVRGGHHAPGLPIGSVRSSGPRRRGRRRPFAASTPGKRRCRAQIPGRVSGSQAPDDRDVEHDHRHAGAQHVEGGPAVRVDGGVGGVDGHRSLPLVVVVGNDDDGAYSSHRCVGAVRRCTTLGARRYSGYTGEGVT